MASRQLEDEAVDATDVAAVLAATVVEEGVVVVTVVVCIAKDVDLMVSRCSQTPQNLAQLRAAHSWKSDFLHASWLYCAQVASLSSHTSAPGMLPTGQNLQCRAQFSLAQSTYAACEQKLNPYCSQFSTVLTHEAAATMVVKAFVDVVFGAVVVAVATIAVVDVECPS